MTNQQAIERIKYRIETASKLVGSGINEDCFEDLKMAIKALSNSPEEILDIVEILDTLKKYNPNQILLVETPKGSLELKMKDAIIYEGVNGELVIDSE